MTSDTPLFAGVDEYIRDNIINLARERELQIARALLRGDKSIEFIELDDRRSRYDLTTKWWQVLRRRKLICLARATLANE